MSETIFAFDKHNYRNCQRAYQGPRNQDYYLGDYSIEEAPVIDVRADRQTVGSCSIALLRSRSRLFFRRAKSHIRQDGVDVTVLWFVRRGRLHIHHQRGHSIAEVGDFAITNSTRPFSIECLTDGDSRHEVFHVVLPTHVFRRFVPDEVRTGFCIRAEGRAFTIAQRILQEVFDDPGELSEHIAETLMGSALSVLAEALRGHDIATARQTVAERRLEEALKYIDVHLSDPKLSVAAVAEGCGISQRYLSLLLQRNGTPFSSLVWDKRLNVASSWLASSVPMKLSISEVAYGVGFKSPAHFSRMFKRVYKKSPREFRASDIANLRNGASGLVAGNVGTVQ
jgi:AraC-like DNA-binding protein